MKRQLCWTLVVLLAVVLVKSESTIEVDENGDEYEVKRFNIEGRQLNGGQKQCVEVRRKRSARAYGMNDKEDEAQDEQLAALLTLPSSVDGSADTQTGDAEMNLKDEGLEEDDDMKEMEDNEKEGHHQMDKDKGKVKDEKEMKKDMKKEVKKEVNKEMKKEEENHKKGESEKVEEMHKEEEEDDEEEPEPEPEHEQEVQDQTFLKPLKPILVAQQIPVSIASLPKPTPTRAPPVSGSGVVVVQSVEPPQVDPETHAVFELIPVDLEGYGEDYDLGYEEEDYDEEESPNWYDYSASNDDDHILYEELEPVTTTAIWTTGDDNYAPSPETAAVDASSDAASTPNKKKKKKKNDLQGRPPRRKGNKNKRKKPQKNKRRPLRGDKRKKPNRRIKNPNRPQRPIRNKNKKKNPNKNKRPNKNKNKNKKKPSTVKPLLQEVSPIDPDDAQDGQDTYVPQRKPAGTLQKKRRPSQGNRVPPPRRQQARPTLTLQDRLENQRRKNHRLKEDKNQGTNTFTRTMTVTRTGTMDQDVNCIIIYKSPPPTTPRPFWNILGRSAGARPVASGHFGHRKRVNTRLD